MTGGLVDRWAHKLRSLLTLTLLMLGVLALVVMVSVLDGFMDKIGTGFAGMSWDGTLLLVPKEPQTSEEQKHYAMSPGLRFEDLARLTAPHPKILGFSPRSTKRSSVRVAGGTERIYVTRVSADCHWLMDRPVGSGRGLTPDDQRRLSTVAVVGATLASKLVGGADPVGIFHPVDRRTGHRRIFQIQILQKVPQIGVLKAIGSSNGVVGWAAVIQIIVVTTIGVAIGCLLSYLFSLALPPTIPFVFNGSRSLIAIGLLLFIGPLGGMISIIYAVRIEQLKALRLG